MKKRRGGERVEEKLKACEERGKRTLYELEQMRMRAERAETRQNLFLDEVCGLVPEIGLCRSTVLGRGDEEEEEDDESVKQYLREVRTKTHDSVVTVLKEEQFGLLDEVQACVQDTVHVNMKTKYVNERDVHTNMVNLLENVKRAWYERTVEGSD